MIERNMTDPNKQPEDLYTSTHRAIFLPQRAGLSHVA